MYKASLHNWVVGELAGLGFRSRSSNIPLGQGQVNNDGGWPGRETCNWKATSYPAAVPLSGGRIERPWEHLPASLSLNDGSAKPAEENGRSATR